MGRKEYTSTSIPKEVAEMIDKHIDESGPLGYSDRADWLRDAIRLKLMVDKKLLKILSR